jgi:hypothetical protein
MGRRAVWALALLLSAGGHGVARGDGGNVARNVDAVAKEREDEFNELKKKDTPESAKRRFEILKGLAFAPCPTAQRFLLGLVKKSNVPGDERLWALDSLARIADEGAHEDLLAALVSAKDATLWQVFAEALTDRLSEPVRAWYAGPGLDSPHADAVSACLEALRLKPDAAQAPRVAAIWAKTSKSPAKLEVAFRALRVLARLQAATAKPALIEAARSPQQPLRLAAAETIPTLEPFDAECEAAVRGLFQDEDGSVQRTAVALAGLWKRAGLVPALVPMLGDPRARTRHAVSKALAAITGQTFGLDAKAWAAWLEKRDPGKPETVTVPTYHGVPVESDRVVFLVDGSSSMTWPWRREPHRIDVARAEIAAVLKKLPPETLFDVLVFSDKVVSWKKGEVAATPDNVASALSWTEKALAKPAGDTHLFEALDAAFKNDPAFDTIYLLTDGNPVHGRYWTTRGLLASVRAWTLWRRAAVHSIGLTLVELDPGMPNLTEDFGAMKDLLEALAGATSGSYREVRGLSAPLAPAPR